jgi:hypothetical protein
VVAAQSIIELAAWGLPAILLIVLLQRLVVWYWTHSLAMWAIFRRHCRAIALVIASLIFLIFDLPFLVNHVADATNSGWKFWLETLSGNWNPDNFPALAQITGSQPPTSPNLTADRYMYSLAASIALWLNNAVFLIVGGLIWELVSERGRAMNIMQAFVVKDADIKDALLAALPDEQALTLRPLIEEAFRSGSKTWERETLPKVLGATQAQKFLSSLKEQDFKPQPN